VLTASLAGAARRLTQTVVIFVVLAMAATAALVGLTLATNPPRRSRRCPPATAPQTSR
jgi:hypothetical protein